MAIRPFCLNPVAVTENAPPEPLSPPQQRSQATLIVVLGILGIWPAFFLGPVAWLLARGEIAAIDAGIRPANRRRRAVIGRRLGIVGTCLWAAIIPAYLIWGDGLGRSPSISGSFEAGEEPAFIVETDEFVSLLIEDGHYRIRIHDGGPPQTIRSVNSFTSGATRFEATVTQTESGSEAILGIGCWNGDQAYVLAVNPLGEAGLIEFRSTRTTDARVLAAPQAHPALRPVGEPNHLRIDCLGGGTEPTVVVGSVNEQTIVSVALPLGVDQFNAFGFWVVADGPFEVAVDDYRWAAERREPAIDPVTVRGGDSLAARCDGLVSAFADSAQALMDGMSAWESFEAFEAASEEEVRAVQGQVLDEFIARAWRTNFWGCRDAADDLPGRLNASNPIAEEFLARISE